MKLETFVDESIDKSFSVKFKMQSESIKSLLLREWIQAIWQLKQKMTIETSSPFQSNEKTFGLMAIEKSVIKNNFVFSPFGKESGAS